MYKKYKFNKIGCLPTHFRSSVQTPGSQSSSTTHSKYEMLWVIISSKLLVNTDINDSPNMYLHRSWYLICKPVQGPCSPHFPHILGNAQVIFSLFKIFSHCS